MLALGGVLVSSSEKCGQLALHVSEEVCGSLPPPGLVAVMNRGERVGIGYDFIWGIYSFFYIVVL